MEQRLKKQRNRLFLRVSLILIAVWLTVSATYCVIRLNAEDADVQNRELANLSYAKQQMSTAVVSVDAVGVLLTNTNALYSEENSYDSQFVVTDKETDNLIIDTAGKVLVSFTAKTSAENTDSVSGYVEYKAVHDVLKKEELKKITDYLNREPEAGKHYDLVCTKFRIKGFEIIPVELKIALVDENDAWFIMDEIIETFDLSENREKGDPVYNCGEMKRNIIPKGFLLNGEYGRDYIGKLSDLQRGNPVTTVSTGLFEYIFYAVDYLNLNNSYIDRSFYSYENNPHPVTLSYTIQLQYARKINLLDNCKLDLIAGTLIIFAFFLIIAFILCFMIWKMVRNQIVGEQKRLSITGALAHDIKTPLFVISGYAYSLREDIDPGERDSYLEKIIEQTDEINSLVHNMLSYSMLDSLDMTLNRVEVDLGELARGIASDFKSLPDGRRVELSISGNNTVNADCELLKTVFKNLLDNALKYSKPDSVINIDINGKSVKISNSSEPLTKTELKQLWQPYVRKDKSRHQKGNGLGLSIVKSILDLHSARYGLTMRGDVFTIWFSFDM